MNEINLSVGFNCPFVALPCAFTDYFMQKCKPVYALIYIYSLRRCQSGSAAVTNGELAEIFQVLETDVHNAWSYWEKEGLVSISADASDESMNVKFLQVQEKTEKKEEKARFASEPRPHYTAEELAVYPKECKEIERLFKQAEQSLAKLLTYHDMNVIFGFYDWLHLSVDVIIFMLSYCAENGKRDLRYAEKTAMDWADRGIDSVEAAEEYVKSFSGEYKEIYKAFGQTGYPTATQRKYVEKWKSEYNFTGQMIFAAIDRCATNLGKPKFNYVDKILDDWFIKNIKTAEGIEAEDDAHIKKKTEEKITPVKKAPAGRPGKKNRFINYSQREIDYSSMEKMEREYLINSLEPQSHQADGA
ncbi:MAG: DnaD domain protein [Defluviitaleaceae bacterium]|nr:DnaD domain protein [Defluviitaleaceae bacterium]